jgi:hypothetical protein
VNNQKDMTKAQAKVIQGACAINNKLVNNQYGPGESKESVEIMLNNKQVEYERLANKYLIEKSDIDNYLVEAKKSDIFEGFSNLIENFRQYLDTLTLDQIVILLNIFGYFMIFQALISICLILLGDSLILKFNLETRYPKFSKFIKVRTKISKAHL